MAGAHSPGSCWAGGARSQEFSEATAGCVRLRAVLFRSGEGVSRATPTSY